MIAPNIYNEQEYHIIFGPPNAFSIEIPINKDASLFLLNPKYKINFFELMPKTFIISTNNSSGKFNIELLKDTSLLILHEFSRDQHKSQYYLNTNDDKNVLGKLEQLYQGKLVSFDKSEIPIYNEIKNILMIKNLPNLDNSNNATNFNYIKNPLNASILSLEITKNNFFNFLKNLPKNFTIITNRKEYRCNAFGVLSSKVISDAIHKEPTLNEYVYNHDDEFDEFQSICDLFNFETVKVTTNNMNSLKEIAEDLQIESILCDIDNMISEFEKISETIDEKQQLIESIDELFEWLYHIKEKTVKEVSRLIIDSELSNTKEGVEEVGAFILQVVKTNLGLHCQLSELIFELDKESDSSNNLEILKPFIVNKVMSSFGESKQNCSFIYNLRKKGIIQAQEVTDKLNQINVNEYSNNQTNYSTNIKSLNDNIIDWFLPDIFQMEKFDYNRLINNLSFQRKSFFTQFFPGNIEKYKEMLEAGEPTDELTKALRHDDVESLQKFVLKNQIDITKAVVPYNIYEDYIINGQTNYLNYSASYGSVKCFKHLLLNHVKVDLHSFKYAIYGGNTEIIKIVDQNSSNITEDDQKQPLNNMNNRNNHFLLNHMNGYHQIVNRNNQQRNFDQDADRNDPWRGFARHHNDNPFGGFTNKMNNNEEEKLINLSKIVLTVKRHQNNLFDWILEQKFLSDPNFNEIAKKIALRSAENGNVHSLIALIDRGFDFLTADYLIPTAAINGFYRFSKILYDLYVKNADEKRMKKILSGFHFPSFVIFGNIFIFKMFIKNMNQNDFEQCLAIAVEKEYIDIIHFYFDTLFKENVKLRADGLLPSLNYSVIKKSNKIFYYLIENCMKINPNIFKQFQWTSKVLPSACEYKNFEAVKTIIDIIIKDKQEFEKSNENKENLFYYSRGLSFTDSFLLAIISKSLEICKYFIQNEVKIDFDSIVNSKDKLRHADAEIFSLVYENCSQVAKQIIKEDYLKTTIQVKNKSLTNFLINLNITYPNVLIDAVKTLDVDLVDIVIKHNSKPAFINKITDKGTALCIAASKNNLQIVKLLLSLQGIDPTLYNKYNETPLLIAVNDLDKCGDIANSILDFYGDNYPFSQWEFSIIMSRIVKLKLFDPKCLNFFIRIIEMKNPRIYVIHQISSILQVQFYHILVIMVKLTL
ncbi:hypothetical protein M9Y10_007921 [Tritrichomonas musculus]|uniref:DUF3447 domain-containing protein n=1 Tax=Tritrichomonas musculus TaxID=1915356 RepID=A0ABR2J3E1_9EUKA